MNAETLTVYPTSLAASDGPLYQARVCGRAREDGQWEGWIEFEREDGGAAIRTTRETTQPNRTDLLYWANGLTPVYLEGAFRRATEPAPQVVERELPPPIFDGPAPASPGPGPVNAVLDPFEAYASGETILRSRLGALSAWHLRNIVRAHSILVEPLVVEAMTKPELIEYIVAAARTSAVIDGASAPPSVP